ncbi:MAG: D-2-hydroxyacid dehydrogenase [Candidatus Latescibacteria bacterium]|nr:D-2-hydroxyacid dehydrogenase [Candidatus Latescibacterota bacterium]
MKLVTTHRLPEEAVRAISPDIEIIQVSGHDALLQAATDADAIIGGFGGTPFRQILQAARRVRWIHTSSAGVDTLICPELLSRDIVLTCGKGHAVGTLLAEHAFALVLALTRGIAACARMKTWGRNTKTGRSVLELRGRTMGLVGFGGVGLALAPRARAFDMDVVAVRRTPPDSAPEGVTLWGMDRFPDLLARSDVVVASVPLTEETRGMFNRQAFERMKPTALLVNVGRGEVVDTVALVDALRDNKIAGAGMDVFEQEPLPDDSPLWGMENVIITPHIAGNSPDRGGRNQETVLENLRRFVQGQALIGAVDKSAGY